MEDVAGGLVGLGADVEWPDSLAIATARDHFVHATSGIGRLGEIIEWLSGAQAVYPPTLPTRVRLLRYGPSSDVADALAADTGVGVLRLDGESFEDGVAIADDEVDSGAGLLLISGRGDPDTCALATSAATGAEPVALLPRGAAAVDTAAWIGRAEYLRDRRAELLAVRESPDELLRTLGDPMLASACGLVARATSRRTPVILDGTLAVVAALVALGTQPRFSSWWRIADVSADPVQVKARGSVDPRPLLDLGIDAADGTAALLAYGVIRTAIAVTGTDPGKMDS